MPNVCSPLNLEGTCDDGKLCSPAGLCEFECSDTNVCSDATRICKNNKCVPKICSPQNLEGTCEGMKLCNSAGACEFQCSDTKACTNSLQTCVDNKCVSKVCSPENKSGTCEDRKVCNSAGACEFECSDTKVCTDTAKTCNKNNVCVPKICSPENLEGTCTGDLVCGTQGQCIEDPNKCLPTKKDGTCPDGQGCDPAVGECRQKCTTLGAIKQCGVNGGNVCDGTLCQQQPPECSVLNKVGTCSSQQQTCVEGQCKDLCGPGFLNGVCTDYAKQCINEECQVPCSVPTPTGACSGLDAFFSTSGECVTSIIKNRGFESASMSGNAGAADWDFTNAYRVLGQGSSTPSGAPSGKYYA